MDLDRLQVLRVRLSASFCEDEVIFAADDERRRLMLAKVAMPFVVALDIAAIIRVVSLVLDCSCRPSGFLWSV